MCCACGRAVNRRTEFCMELERSAVHTFASCSHQRALWHNKAPATRPARAQALPLHCAGRPASCRARLGHTCAAARRRWPAAAGCNALQRLPGAADGPAAMATADSHPRLRDSRSCTTSRIAHAPVGKLHEPAALARAIGDGRTARCRGQTGHVVSVLPGASVTAGQELRSRCERHPTPRTLWSRELLTPVWARSCHTTLTHLAHVRKRRMAQERTHSAPVCVVHAACRLNSRTPFQVAVQAATRATLVHQREGHS